MRYVLTCLILSVSVMYAGEVATPVTLSPATQKLVDDSVILVTKARQAFDQTAKKEQDKLVAALTKEQERETKKGNLDGALAIKALIEDVQTGLLARKSDEATDLMGEGGAKAPAPGTLPANLATDCPIAVTAAHAEDVPKAIETMMARAMVLAIPKGDKTRYTFTAASGGTIAILTGTSERNHADIWPDLLKAGFKRGEDGDGAWFILEAKPGTKFTAYDPPLAGAQLQIFAGKIKLMR